MASDFDVALAKMEGLLAWANDNVTDDTRNEATTRLHLIDRLIFGCLGWNLEDCAVEESYQGTYTDYSLGRPARKLIVEAKREGVYFDLPDGFDKRTCPLKTLREGNHQLNAAIEQVLSYCQSRGIPIAAVCNGRELIAFIGSRQDGVPPLEGRALVFASLEDMRANFRELWRNLSRPGLEAYNIYGVLKSDGLPPPEKLSQRLQVYPGFKNRNEIQGELKILGELFIEDIAQVPEVEEEFLKNCYCPSGALSQYASISKQILETRYSVLLQKEIEVPTMRPAREKNGIAKELPDDILAASMSRRPIILLGDVGVGKTMFIRHFISVDAKELLERAIVLYIDFGKEPALANDLNSFILRHCMRQLRKKYGIDLEERNFVRGVYHFELNRFAKGIYADLATIDKQKFVEKEIEFLDGKLQDLSAHLRSCLEHITNGQQRQIVIFLDNIDQRPFEFQEQVFLIGHSLAETWPCTVFMSLRPDTFFQSRAKGSLSAYQPRVFTVAPPRVDLVISKRLRFALKQLAETGRLASFPQGLWLKSETLSAYVNVVLNSFEENRDLMEFVDNLSGGNVRAALDFVTAFVGSGHVDTDKILGIVRADGGYIIPVHEFMRAVIFGDHEYYDPITSPVTNLFDISMPDGREHFLLGIILALVERSSSSSNEGFVETHKIYDFCQGLGFQPSQINAAIERARQKRLLEPGARFSDPLGTRNYRITTVGAYTYVSLIRYVQYVDAMVVDTPIVDEDVNSQIRDCQYIRERLERVEIFSAYLDRHWQALSDKVGIFDWRSVSHDLREGIRRIRSSL